MHFCFYCNMKRFMQTKLNKKWVHKEGTIHNWKPPYEGTSKRTNQSFCSVCDAEVFDCSCRSLHVQLSPEHRGGRCQAVLTWGACEAADCRNVCSTCCSHHRSGSVSAERTPPPLKTHILLWSSTAKNNSYNCTTWTRHPFPEFLPSAALNCGVFFFFRNAFLEHFEFQFMRFSLLLKLPDLIHPRELYVWNDFLLYLGKKNICLIRKESQPSPIGGSHGCQSESVRVAWKTV